MENRKGHLDVPAMESLQFLTSFNRFDRMKTRIKMALGVSAGLLLVAGGLWWFNRAKPPRPSAPMVHAKPLPALEIPVEAPETKSAVAVEKGTAGPAPLVGATAGPDEVQRVRPDPVAQPVGVPDRNAPVVVTLASAPSADSALAQSTDEPTATVRMYAAHASLRTPEVADPDSLTNKRILSTMVAKVLAQPATPPPATPNTR